MPRSNTGNCTLAEDAFVPNTTISSADVNSDLSDIASMLTDSLSRSGDGGMSANLNMGSHQINGMTAGTVTGDAVAYEQLTGQNTAIQAQITTINTHLTSLDTSVSSINTSITTINTHLTTIDGQITTLQSQFNSALSGTPVSKTAAYAILNADKGKTFYFSGAAQYTVSMGAASGFDTDFQTRISNVDTRGKIIDINGVSIFILMPRQTVTVSRTGSVWTVFNKPIRWQPGVGVAVTLYCDYTLGSDSNDGLAAGSGNAIKNIQEAVNRIQFASDGNFRIQLSVGTHYVASGIFVTGSVLGADQFQMFGDLAAPTNHVIEADVGAACVNVQDNAVFVFGGVYLTITGGGAGNGVFARQESIIDAENVDYGPMSGGTHISCTTMASIGITGNYNIYGSAALHIGCSYCGYINYGNYTVTIPASLAFTYFMTLNGCSNINNGAVPMTFTGAGLAGTSGIRYSVAYNAVAIIGVTLPGNAGGSVTGGGVYV